MSNKNSMENPALELTPNDTQKAWLEIILNGVKEGAILCDRNARIMLCNETARNLFHNSKAMEEGRSLYGLCSRIPVEQTLNLLDRQRRAGAGHIEPNGGDTQFVCSAIEDGTLITCRLRLLTTNSSLRPSFIIFFDDDRRRGSRREYRGHFLRSKVEELRSPLANLRAAAENLVTHPEMDPVMHSAFENVIAQECVSLTERFESLAQEIGSLTVLQKSPFADIYSKDLIEALNRRLSEEDGPVVSMRGSALWFKADGHLLLQLMEYFISRIKELFSVYTIEIETLSGDSCVYLDIVWEGDPVPAPEIESWCRQPFTGGEVADLTAAVVLELHDSDVWSQHHKQKGRAMVRIPVPLSSRKN